MIDVRNLMDEREDVSAGIRFHIAEMKRLVRRRDAIDQSLIAAGALTPNQARASRHAPPLAPGKTWTQQPAGHYAATDAE